MMMYVQDYDDHYPQSTTFAEQTDSTMPGKKFEVSASACTSGNYVNWMDLIYPYIKNVQLFVCPSVRNSRYPSYGYNGALGNATNKYFYNFAIYVSGGPYPPLSLAAVHRPSEIYAVVEYNYSAGIWASPASQRSAAISTSESAYLRVVPHLGGGNVTYADGHVKWVNAEVFKSTGEGTSSCYMDEVDKDLAYCNRNWNPFIP